MVIGLGVLIFIGLTVLIGTISFRVSNMADADEPVGAFDITLPKGAQIQSSTVNGEQLVVHLVFPSDPLRQEILVINHLTGDTISTIDVKSEP